LAVGLQKGVFVVSEPLKVRGPVVERLIVYVVEVIAPTASALSAGARRQKGFGHQLVNLHAANATVA
jgi:hypothetical protein